MSGAEIYTDLKTNVAEIGLQTCMIYVKSHVDYSATFFRSSHGAPLSFRSPVKRDRIADHC